MRIIAGAARGIPLKTIPGNATRPTTDRIKETLFNMLQPYLYEASFLDLFSGSGAIGLEAASRGATSVVLVEQEKAACSCIRDNMTHTRLAQGCRLFQKDVFTALRELEGTATFDLIFMDPPYNQLLEKKVLTYLSDSRLIHEDTLLVVEASLETDFSYVENLGFTIIKYKKYKTNVHVFLQKAHEKEADL